MSAIHVAHATATIVRIGAEAATEGMGREEDVVRGTANPQLEQPGEDETMADSEDNRNVSKGPPSAHGVKELFACERDPLALNLGHNSSVKTCGYHNTSRDHTDLSFGGGGSRLESWVKSSDYTHRGVVEANSGPPPTRNARVAERAGGPHNPASSPVSED